MRDLDMNVLRHALPINIKGLGPSFLTRLTSITFPHYPINHTQHHHTETLMHDI